MSFRLTYKHNIELRDGDLRLILFVLRANTPESKRYIYFGENKDFKRKQEAVVQRIERTLTKQRKEGKHGKNE